MSASYRNRSKPRRYRLPSDIRLFLDVLLVAIPTLGLLMWFWMTSSEPFSSRLIVTGLVIGWVLLMAGRVRQHFVYHLRTLSTLVEAIRQEDYSFRSSRFREPGDLGELYQQVNALADRLQRSEQQEQELRGLLKKVISQIQVAILAFDNLGSIRLVNPQASRLAAIPAEDMVGRSIADTPFSDLKYSDDPVLIDRDFPGAAGRWQVSWQEYRQEARPGKLLFITDLRQVLGEQETRAWQSLIRVIAHEINNSLTPISSITQTLASKVASGPVAQSDEDFLKGLGLVGQRSHELTRFIAEYARIARLPEPHRQRFSLVALIERLMPLYDGRVVFEGKSGEEGLVLADPILIEQLMINLIKNALEASASADYPVELRVSATADDVQVLVLDRGHGIGNPANLFVPFYTTKPKGTGIGLVLCRQIADAHGGRLSLENRTDGGGAVARLDLPTHRGTRDIPAAIFTSP